MAAVMLWLLRYGTQGERALGFGLGLDEVLAVFGCFWLVEEANFFKPRKKWYGCQRNA